MPPPSGQSPPFPGALWSEFEQRWIAPHGQPDPRSAASSPAPPPAQAPIDQSTWWEGQDMPVDEMGSPIGVPGPGSSQNWFTRNAPAASTAPTSSASATDVLSFIQNWQNTHPASEGIGPLADALKPLGVTRYMYGNTPSNNEFLINGQKFKVLSGEDNPNTASWYRGGNDSGGGSTPATATQPPPKFDFAPWTETFQGPTFQAPTNLTEQNDPGYQARLALGQQAIERSAAAKGTLLTGGTLQDVQKFGQDFASNEYGNVYNRAADTYGKLYNTQADAYNKRYGQYLDAYGHAKDTFLTNFGVDTNLYGRAFNESNTQWQHAYDVTKLGMPPAPPGSAG